MTTRERILTLADGGYEAHMIAALLGLTVTDVAETLALPAHTPADPGGGGSSPVNWVVFRLAIPEMTHEAPLSGYLSAGDITIKAQSGSDFSVGDSPQSGGAILSAAGGRFQGSFLIGEALQWIEGFGETPYEPLRYLNLSCILGPGDEADPNFEVIEFGTDTRAPMQFVDGNLIQPPNPVTSIGYAKPGDVAIGWFSFDLSNLQPGDVYAAGHHMDGVCWQV